VEVLLFTSATYNSFTGDGLWSQAIPRRKGGSGGYVPAEFLPSGRPFIGTLERRMVFEVLAGYYP
jgi:hypothetical protein